MKRVLFVAHGRAHPKNNPGFKKLTRQMFESQETTFIDVDPNCMPTYTMDVTINNVDFFEHQFDYIFIIFAHYSVLESKVFWHNVQGWLKTNGIVHTILPRVMYEKQEDHIHAHKITKYTGLKTMRKNKYMYRKCQAIILKK